MKETEKTVKEYTNLLNSTFYIIWTYFESLITPVEKYFHSSLYSTLPFQSHYTDTLHCPNHVLLPNQTFMKTCSQIEIATIILHSTRTLSVILMFPWIQWWNPEMSLTGAEIVVHTDGTEVSLTNLKVSASKAGDSRKRTRRYGFDYCFNSATLDSEGHATQEKVYESLGTSALDALFSGFNACLVAYGQSASGKTYTMMGPKNDPGLTPRLCEGLFFRIFEEQQKGNYYDTAVSYLEIYNERVRDLLKPSTNSSGLRVREHPRLGPYVQGLTRQTVSTLGSLMSWVEEGTRARKTASTTQNATSSRSHALLTVSLTSRSENSNSTAGTSSGIEKKQHSGRGARLHLVDLAGSERAGNSNYGLHRLKEGANINKSLVALGNVISALADRGTTGIGPGRRFIPYRDSALTWILKDALGGNATTIMLATISPASGSYNETAHTLRFAHRAQSVINRPVVNEDPVARVIRELRAEISRLTSLLSEKQVVGESGTFCCCKQKTAAEALLENAERGEETSEEKPDIRSKPIEVVHRTSSRLGSGSTLHRKYSSEESLSSKRPQEDKSSSPPCRFGSLKSLSSSEEGIDPQKDQDRTTISTVSYDRVDALALVDIPTLVAVLIKPEDDQSGPVQIEEITGENILESSVDVDAGDLEELASRSIENLVDRVPNFLAEGNEVGLKNFGSEEVYAKQPNATDSAENKKSGGLNTSKKFGSSESFASSGKGAGRIGLGQRSYTNLHLDKGKSQVGVTSLGGKVKRTWSPRGSITPGSPKKLESDKDVQRQKSSKEVGQQRIWNNPPRKQEPESPKRRVSKDESALTSALKTTRKGSVGSEVPCRTSTPIQRTNRRAKIVAAVTERLYSTKKPSEETLAASQGTEFRSREGSEVKLANATRMKLQEISRKMLAKRRKTCADTQTDVASTVRVKDTASLTDDPKVETKDAAVTTDLSEDCQQTGTEFLPVFPVTRVKEMATLTERFSKTVRCRDAGVVTEDRDFDATSDDDTLETWAFPRKPSYAENSTNTTAEFSQTRFCAASQTCTERPLHCSKKLADCHKGFNVCHGPQECCHQVNSNPVSCGVERSVISITLPDMLSITIESPNLLDSKIAVTEANASSMAEEKVSARVRDDETENKGQGKSPRVVDEDLKTSHILPAESLQTVATRSASCQSDGRTFRIENIFEDPKSCAKVNDRCVAAELMPDLTEHITPKTSLKLTNSVGTSFGPETSERSTEIEGMNFFDAKIAWQSRRDTCWRKLRTEDLKFFDTTSRKLPSHSVLTSASDAKYNLLKPSAKLDAEELKSPLLVAKMLANSGIDADSSFSDDSLDPEETRGKSTLRVDEALCPPDVVAHTKKEPYESRIEEDFAEEAIELPRLMVSAVDTSRVHDYETLVLGRSCFVPIVGESGDISRIETPESEEGCRGNLKKKVSFSNSKPSSRPRGSEARRPKPIIKNALSSDSDGLMDKTLKMNASTPQDCSASEASFRDDISSISESSETVRSGPLYNSDEESDAVQAKRNDLDMKRVRFTPLLFGERGESGTSDSDGCENAVVSDEDGPCCGARMEVFASYLDEATAFVHNMNTMNEFFGASMTFHNAGDEDFIEYQGRRVSLKDDTDEYLKQEEFNVPIDSYRNCLRGIEKLENCIENAVQHDKFLFEKYGLSLESAATSFNLVDSGQTPFHRPEHLSSSFEELACVSDEETPSSSPKKLSSDVETRIFQQLMEATSPRRLARSAKPYFRRSTRVSDLRVKSPRPRRRHRDPEEPKVLWRPGDLEAPRCFLAVPEAGRESSGREYRSDGGTSSSDQLDASSESIDTVASVRNGFRYPGSPRAKLMQLVSERRQIVHRSRSEAPSPR
ncbi:uncharacterized protein LOC124407927 [Diprion similis]|uniref:uncharacterized protein LOC124407927 n=1 Tax=Diprion similis TaxID=362088 RepID=UPI001EF8BE67|nr:uncharacterized protein LOC124407927 [Diprion similis]